MGKYILLLTNKDGFSWVHMTAEAPFCPSHQRFITYSGADYVGNFQVRQGIAVDYQIVKVG